MLLELVKNSPQWKALSAMRAMDCLTFSYCLAGFCRGDSSIVVPKEIYPFYQSLLNSIEQWTDWEGKPCFYLNGVEGNKKQNDFVFPMIAYMNYCSEIGVEYPLSVETTTKRMLTNENETVRIIENEFKKESLAKAEIETQQRLAKKENTAKPAVAGLSDKKEKAVEKEKTDGQPKRFGYSEICNSVEFKQLLDPNSPKYLPRLEILLKIAISLIEETDNKKYSSDGKNQAEIELRKATIGTNNNKDAVFGVAGKDLNAIERMLYRDSITNGGKSKKR